MDNIEFDRNLFELTLGDIEGLEQPSSTAPDARFAFLMYLDDLRDRVTAYRVAATLMEDQGLLAQIQTADETLARATARSATPEPPIVTHPPRPVTPALLSPTPRRPATPFPVPSVASSSGQRRATSPRSGLFVEEDRVHRAPSVASVPVSSRAPSPAPSAASGTDSTPYFPHNAHSRSSSPSSVTSTTAVAYFPMRDEVDYYPRPLIQCTACLDDIIQNDFVTPCSHHYHSGCMAALFDAAVSEEWFFPPQCCGQKIDLDTVLDALPADVRRRSLHRIEQIQDLLRVYCPNDACGAVLGLQHDLTAFVTCPDCSAVVCTACRSVHPIDMTCAQHEDALPIVDLANAQRWTRCPGCRRYVERSEGCPHMQCVCSTQFCYLCAALWKTCGC